MNDNIREFDLTPPKRDIIALKEFLSKFSPATSFKDANRYFTTKDFHDLVEEHFGWDEFGMPEVVAALKELGFVIDKVEGKGICWMVG